MARARPMTPQRRAARELARTPVANPYRRQLADPFSAPARAAEPAELEAGPIRPGGSRPAEAAVEPVNPASGVAGLLAHRSRAGVPGAASLAGVLGIVLGLVLGLFGLLLVTVVSLQDSYGTADRSFYRGTDSGYVVLGMIDFGLTALCGLGGVLLLGGRITGRIMMTAGGWACLILSGYWLIDSTVSWIVPPVLAVLASIMVLAAYTGAVTRWLGVLPAPQPE